MSLGRRTRRRRCSPAPPATTTGSPSSPSCRRAARPAAPCGRRCRGEAGGVSALARAIARGAGFGEQQPARARACATGGTGCRAPVRQTVVWTFDSSIDSSIDSINTLISSSINSSINSWIYSSIYSSIKSSIISLINPSIYTMLDACWGVGAVCPATGPAAAIARRIHDGLGLSELTDTESTDSPGPPAARKRPGPPARPGYLEVPPGGGRRSRGHVKLGAVTGTDRRRDDHRTATDVNAAS